MNQACMPLLHGHDVFPDSRAIDRVVIVIIVGITAVLGEQFGPYGATGLVVLTLSAWTLMRAWTVIRNRGDDLPDRDPA